MPRYPKSVQQLIEAFARLPGIGPKTAERLVFYLLDHHLDAFISAVNAIKGSVHTCTDCFNISEHERCQICSDPTRNQLQIVVVAKPQDVAVFERSGLFTGVYHILGGLLDPLSGITSESLRIAQLKQRVLAVKPQEVILAFDNSVEGESTALYLTQGLSSLVPTLTRLARGLPMGSDIEYTDDVTLRAAFEYRQSLRNNNKPAA